MLEYYYSNFRNKRILYGRQFLARRRSRDTVTAGGEPICAALGRNGFALGRQSHRVADTRAAVPVGSPDARRGDLRGTGGRTLERKQQPQGTAELESGSGRSFDGRPPRSLRNIV